MKIIKAHARTGYYFDFDANSDKLYRVIQAGPFTVFNWSRVGGPIGQLAIAKHPSETAARAAADKKWQDKTGPRARDRYDRDQEFVDFDIDLDRIRDDKASATQVVHVLRAASRGAGEAPTPDPIRSAPEAPVARDRIASLTERALDVIELAVSQPAEALAAYADLNEQWKKLQEDFERIESMVQTADTMVATA